MLADDKANTGDVTYSNGTYSMTVTATGKKDGWSGATDATTKIKIGGIEVSPSTVGWTISGKPASGSEEAEIKVDVKNS